MIRPRPQVEFDDALGALHLLLLGLADVEAFLGEVAVLAAATAEGDVACGIIARFRHRPVMSAFSDARAVIAHEEQDAGGQGPCLEALSTERIVDVPDQEADHRWESYREAVLAVGVKCSLSLPLFVDQSSVGALNLYGFDATHGLSGLERHRAEVFAAEASTALTLTLRFTDQTEQARLLVETQHARAVIDQAIGVLMVQQHCDSRTAFDLLRRRSQSSNEKIRDVAAALVERASGHPLASPSPFGVPDLDTD